MTRTKFFITLMGIFGSCLTAQADIHIFPNDSLISGAHPGREGKLPPINPRRPDGIVDNPIDCSYGPGFLELALPHGVQYIKVRIFNSLQDWTGMVTVEQSRVEIPLFTGECRIICWTDDNRQYFGKLNFPDYQKDEAGNIIGGETFVVTAPKLNLQPTFPINSTPVDDNGYELSVDDEEIATISWTNHRDEELGTAESVVVKGAYEPMTYYATAYYEDGTMATGSIIIEASTGIESWQIANDRQKNICQIIW